MKLNKALLLFIILPAFSYCQTSIDIDDRTNLSLEFYDSLKDYRAILVGELHGTNEVPELVEAIVQLWLKKENKVILALELPQSQQHVVDSFVVTGNFSIIENMWPFSSKVQDGRSGTAMGTLLKNIRELKNLKVFLFDPADTKSGQERDSMMADLILQKLEDNPDHKLILLAGNLHSKLTKGLYADTAYRPMGYFLAHHNLFRSGNLMALKVVCQLGKSWLCSGPDDYSCKVTNLPVNNTYTSLSKSSNFLHLQQTYKNTIGYLGILFIKEVTASMPLSK
jgi:hypothetical protein